MSRKKPWTPEEEGALRQLFPTTPNREISKKIGRSVDSLMMKANRLGLVKGIEANRGGSHFENRLQEMSREDTMKLDKIDLLSINWSLLQMYRRELNNPEITAKTRIKLMVALSDHLETINAVMRGYEDRLGSLDDLQSEFKTLEDKHSRHEPIPRRRRESSKSFTTV